MPYSSSLSDREWELIEPLLPKKKKTKPPTWTKRQILDGVFYQLKNGCNWGDLPKDLPPYPTVFWHYKQWRSEGVLDEIMDVLHAQVRQQAKKNALDAIVNCRFASRKEYLQCQYRVKRVLSLQRHQWHQAPSGSGYVRVAVFHTLHEGKRD